MKDVLEIAFELEDRVEKFDHIEYELGEHDIESDINDHVEISMKIADVIDWFQMTSIDPPKKEIMQLKNMAERHIKQAEKNRRTKRKNRKEGCWK
ncbi:hypothetical protein [Halogeometricum sp. CBA1124]|uniref:hypothetical protein n=1 Tax=Halogeometricum sp. CBA1124 TaxID=2668071 RepID=UPI0014294627|nr:hypothetical protein [Halogeometricum sp. CBA1124]MUV56093.1 hypothetical protein [Halogeometricum sp. CBA1124]